MEWAAVAMLAAVTAFALFFAYRAKGGNAPPPPDETPELRAKLRYETERRESAEAERDQLRQQREAELAKSAAENAALKQQLAAAEKQAEEKIALLQQVRAGMEAEFKNLSQNILEEKAQKFGDASRAVLQPLGEQLKNFRARVDEIHDVNTRAAASLQTEIRALHNNAVKIGADANNLAAALKGESKTQGDWGEIELAALLERSGLREGEGYETQKTFAGDDGDKLRPDVVIHLPGNRHFIIDSKISLRDYADYAAATDEAAKKECLARHARAVRQHALDLAKKNYPSLRGVNAPDMVFMFMAVEPAFLAALAADGNLFNDAYQKKVAMCSPTTLMPVLRATEHLWRLDLQSRKSEEIARQGGALYDKFHGFMRDMEETGRALEKAQQTHSAAVGKLGTGRGNLINLANKLRDLGVNAKKDKLPEAEE